MLRAKQSETLPYGETRSPPCSRPRECPGCPSDIPSSKRCRSDRRGRSLCAPIFRGFDRQSLHRRKQSVHPSVDDGRFGQRSEEHTSELQSPCNLVCRLLLEKKKKALL